MDCGTRVGVGTGWFGLRGQVDVPAPLLGLLKIAADRGLSGR